MVTSTNSDSYDGFGNIDDDIIDEATYQQNCENGRNAKIVVVILVVILALSVYNNISQNNDITTLKQSAVNLNNKMKILELDASRCVEFIDELELLRKSQQSFEEQQRNVRREGLFIALLVSLLAFGYGFLLMRYGKLKQWTRKHIRESCGLSAKI